MAPRDVRSAHTVRPDCPCTQLTARCINNPHRVADTAIRVRTATVSISGSMSRREPNRVRMRDYSPRIGKPARLAGLSLCVLKPSHHVGPNALRLCTAIRRIRNNTLRREPNTFCMGLDCVYAPPRRGKVQTPSMQILTLSVSLGQVTGQAQYCPVRDSKPRDVTKSLSVCVLTLPIPASYSKEGKHVLLCMYLLLRDAMVNLCARANNRPTPPQHHARATPRLVVCLSTPHDSRRSLLVRGSTRSIPLAHWVRSLRLLSVRPPRRSEVARSALVGKTTRRGMHAPCGVRDPAFICIQRHISGRKSVH